MWCRNAAWFVYIREAGKTADLLTSITIWQKQIKGSGSKLSEQESPVIGYFTLSTNVAQIYLYLIILFFLTFPFSFRYTLL